MILLEKRSLRYATYSVFFLVVFSISTALSFPDKQVKEIATVKLQEIVGPKYKVKIADLDLWFLMGFTLEGITIEERVDDAEIAEDEGLPDTLPMKVTLKSISVRFAPLHSVLNLGIGAKAVIDVGGGDVLVYFAQTLDGQKVKLDVDDVDLAKTTILSAYLGVPFFGSLDGGGEFLLNEKGMPIEGKVDLKGTKVTVGPATVKTDKFPPMQYLEIPSTNFGSMNIEMDVNNVSKGRSYLMFSKVWISGRDIRGEAWGHIGLGRTFGASEPDLKLRMQLEDSFVKKNNLTPLLNVAEVRRGKNKDWFGFTISGKLRKIRFRGSADAGGGAEKSPVKSPKPIGGKPATADKKNKNPTKPKKPQPKKK